MFIGTAGAAASNARQKTIPAEAELTLERELLLADGAADSRESPRPASARRSGWLVGLALILIVGALAAVAFRREQKHWEEANATLEVRLARLTVESGEKLEALQKAAAARELELREHKAASQQLETLAQKTLGQLQACLGDLRQERERNQQLATDYHNALKIARPTLTEAIAEFLPPWLRRITPESFKALEAKAANAAE